MKAIARKRLAIPSTLPEVFIIESLWLSDEREELHMGERLSRMLKLSNKNCQYYYIRTKQEFLELLGEFRKSRYRYLHLCCHGCTDGLGTTFDFLDISELGTVLRPYISKRRVFLSACEITTMPFARRLMAESDCYSVMGPYNKISFDRATLFWASFYHLMFREDNLSMNNRIIEAHGKALAKIFKVRMKLFIKRDREIQPITLR